MRLLAIHNVGKDGPTLGAPVHIWRIWRPIRELKKHVDWEIEEQHHLVEALEAWETDRNFTEIELEVAARNLGSYDVVFCSYSGLDRNAYLLMCVVTQRYGTQFVIDCDDDVFSVNEDNPIWLTIPHARMYDLQTIMRDSPWVTTTTERLAHVLKARRPTRQATTCAILPNFIPDDYQHPPIDHGERVTVGYFGGSSHFADLNESGFRKAMADIMRKYKHVDFRAAGVPLDIPMARSRESFVDGVRGLGWITDAFPTLDMDIAVCPLLENVFNDGKSNIKWQEATRMGAAVIASRLGPYADLAPGTAMLIGNTRKDWYDALEHLVTNAYARTQLVTKARAELAKNWRLEDHWEMYQTFFERVAAEAKKEGRFVEGANARP